MKIISKLTFMVLALGLVFTSCKKTPGENAATGAAKEIAKAAAAATAYTVDNTVSNVIWTGSKPAGTHMGTIDVAAGSLSVINGQVSGGNFTLNMNSLTCTDLEGDGKANLENHLKGLTDEEADDFFNVRKYPTASFSISSVTPNTTTPDANFNITGNLQIKDKKQSITFPANIAMLGDKISAVSPSFKINRTEWGINYGSKSVFKDLKDKFIDDDIAIVINLTASK